VHQEDICFFEIFSIISLNEAAYRYAVPSQAVLLGQGVQNADNLKADRKKLYSYGNFHQSFVQKLTSKLPMKLTSLFIAHLVNVRPILLQISATSLDVCVFSDINKYFSFVKKGSIRNYPVGRQEAIIGRQEKDLPCAEQLRHFLRAKPRFEQIFLCAPLDKIAPSLYIICTSLVQL
jgi:hypothetical protein